MTVELQAEAGHGIFHCADQGRCHKRADHPHGICQPESFYPFCCRFTGKPVQKTHSGPGRILGTYGDMVKILSGKCEQVRQFFKHPGFVLVKGLEQKRRGGKTDVNPRGIAAGRQNQILFFCPAPAGESAGKGAGNQVSDIFYCLITHGRNAGFNFINADLCQ